MKKPEIKIIKEIMVYENRYGRLYDDQVLFLPQEKHGTYVRWVGKSSYSVAVLPVMKDRRVVLIENFRHAARKTIIEAPKGFGEDGITPLEMAKKELAEELGLEAERWEYLGKVFTDTSFTYHPMQLFIAWDCYQTGAEKHEDSEVIIGRYYYPLSEAPGVVSDLKINDVTTLFMLMAAHQRSKI